MSRIDVIDLYKVPGSGSEMPDVALPLVVPRLDPEEYRADMAELGMSAEQETEFLETLWSIMGTFARMGFAVDVCGTIFTEFNEASAPESADGRMISSTNMETPSQDRGDGGAE